MLFSSSEIQAFVNTYCSKPEEAPIRQAVAEFLQKNASRCAYLDYTEYGAVFDKISSLAGNISYEIDPNTFYTDLTQICIERETQQIKANPSSFISQKDIRTMIEMIYNKYKHFHACNKALLVRNTNLYCDPMHYIDFAKLIADQSKPERTCLQEHWGEMKAARKHHEMELQKDDITKMIELHLYNNPIGTQSLKSLLKDTVFLDALNRTEFELFLQDALNDGSINFDNDGTINWDHFNRRREARNIMMAAWDEMEQSYKPQKQADVPVPPCQADAPPPYNEAIEMKMHFEASHLIAASIQPAIQLPTAQPVLDAVLIDLERAVRTPEDLQKVYDALQRIKQKHQLESLDDHSNAELKLVAEHCTAFKIPLCDRIPSPPESPRPEIPMVGWSDWFRNDSSSSNTSLTMSSNESSLSLSSAATLNISEVNGAASVTASEGENVIIGAALKKGATILK